MSDLVISPGTIYQLTLAPQAPTRVELSTPGPQGPPGPQGAAGGDYVTYDRNGVPAATWTISHNLGRYPHVSIIADDGSEVSSDVDHADVNTVVITFAVPFSGKAIIG